MMTRRQAECFVTLAETLHFGEAATRLHISQPALSQEIRRLETSIDALLFDRSRRRVALTQVGHDLLPAATAVCAALANADDVIARLRRRTDDVVHVAMSPSVVDAVGTALLRAAERDLRGCSIADAPTTTGELAAALVGGTCDVAIGRFLDLPARYSIEHLGDDPLLAAVSDAAGTASPLALHTLADTPLLLWPREQHPRYYDHLLECCRSSGLDPLVAVSSPRFLDARSYLIAEGRAFGLVPAASAGRLAPGIVARPLDPPRTLPLSMAWLGDDPRPTVRAVVALIRKVVAARRAESRA